MIRRKECQRKGASPLGLTPATPAYIGRYTAPRLVIGTRQSRVRKGPLHVHPLHGGNCVVMSQDSEQVVHTRPVYRYSLLPSSTHIRLLRLGASTPLCGTLTYHSLRDGTSPYTTLSYSWGRDSDGDASLSREILIDGARLAITENLYDGLMRVRPNEERPPYFLWADALCINQGDIPERNSQVAIMADIYRKASNLIIWLGEDHDSNHDEVANMILSQTASNGRYATDWTEDLAIDFFPTYSASLGGLLSDRVESESMFKSMLTLGVHTDDDIYRESEPTYGRLITFSTYQRSSDLVGYSLEAQRKEHANEASMKAHACLGMTDWIFLAEALLQPSRQGHYSDLNTLVTNSLAALVALFGRRYFSRRWIVHEVYNSVPEQTVVLWNQFCWPLKTFVQSSSSLRGLHTPTQYDEAPMETPCGTPDLIRRIHETADHVSNVLNVHTRSTLVGATNPMQCVMLYQGMDCVDPRDRIFAFSSMSLNNSLRPSYQDYSLSAADVYTEFAKSMIYEGRTHDILISAAFQRDDEWSAGFSSTMTDGGLSSWIPDFRLKIYDKISTYRLQDSKLRAVVSPCGKILRLRAIPLTISQVGTGIKMARSGRISVGIDWFEAPFRFKH